MSEIKPCPFCGGRVNAFPPTLNESHIGTDPDKVPGRFYSMIRCTRCMAGMDGPNGDHSCRKVIALWNQRNESALAKAVADERERCERLEQALGKIAMQHKSDEWEEEGDTECGCDTIIEIARAALTPQCGACPGDGSICVERCQLADESPRTEPDEMTQAMQEGKA